MSAPVPAAGITGIVLAGGLGRRMSEDGSGVDKGLQALGGLPMVAHVIARLAPQVDTILINANRNIAAYRQFGYPVLPDLIPGFAGPLAGLHAGMLAAATRWVVTAPCDSPYLPLDLVARLVTAADADGAAIAVVRAGDRLQPVFALVERSLTASLEDYLAQGNRKIDLWYKKHAAVEVDFADPTAFRNINTRQELARYEQGLL
jgi:molybdopterin-guanine dinucleotide biosynthesis protein A